MQKDSHVEVRVITALFISILDVVAFNLIPQESAVLL